MDIDYAADYLHFDNVSSHIENDSHLLADDDALLLAGATRTGLTYLYTVTVIASVVGNGAVITVFTCGKRQQSDLSAFLVNLAVADLIMATFCMPFTFSEIMYNTWMFPAVLCPLVLFLQIVSVSASVYTLMMIGVDRVLAVKFPLRRRVTKTRRKTMIALIWTLAGALSLVQLVVGRVKTYYGPDGAVIVRDCNEMWPAPYLVYRRLFTVVVLMLGYVVPLCILAVAYWHIGRVLWSCNAEHVTSDCDKHYPIKAKRS
ncbi:PREDICTED: substance-P receptor-like, partial [Priapulus caudatus]|uniref:Substance-P receptor-like n=1 Tax=Priapulus caudatus TaxID=37621 RepID=A0ABM1F4M7_PRICU